MRCSLFEGPEAGRDDVFHEPSLARRGEASTVGIFVNGGFTHGQDRPPST
jgi:hypothetical protein